MRFEKENSKYYHLLFSLIDMRLLLNTCLYYQKAFYRARPRQVIKNKLNITLSTSIFF
jgi:hypothetical protein